MSSSQNATEEEEVILLASPWVQLGLYFALLAVGILLGMSIQLQFHIIPHFG